MWLLNASKDRGPVLLPTSRAAAVAHLIGGTASALFTLFWRPTSLHLGDSRFNLSLEDDPTMEVFAAWPAAALSLPTWPISQTADQLGVTKRTVGKAENAGDLSDRFPSLPSLAGCSLDRRIDRYAARILAASTDLTWAKWRDHPWRSK